MPKSTGPTDALNISSHASCVSPDDLLALTRIDDLPEMAEVLAEKEKLSNALAKCEENMHTMRRQIAFYSQKGQADPALAASMATETQTKLRQLEHEHTRVIGELRAANVAIAEARERTRLALMPELRQLALPVIDRRLEDLAVLAMVARLLGAKAPARTMRESHAQERRYLQELRDVLTADPS